ARYAIPVYYLVSTAEASSNLARYDGVRYGFRAKGSREDGPARAARADGDEASLQAMYGRTRACGFGPEVKRRIMLGTYVLSAGYYDAYYLKAQQVRTLILRDYEQAFDRERGVDAIAMPTSPVPAFKIGERVDDPLQMYLADVFTVSANLTGLPAISVPCGFSAGTLPIGLQLTGRRFDEPSLLRLADAYERDTEWWKQQPPLAQMLEVEGGDPDSCLRILRHEVGHAIDNAYRLRRRRTRRRLFGNPGIEYPEYYTPKPYSKSFVHHLDHWYAQSHPDEDFAET